MTPASARVPCRRQASDAPSRAVPTLCCPRRGRRGAHDAVSRALLAEVAVRTALVFGASGQIGASLLQTLHADGWHVTAVSRQPQPAREGVDWVCGDLASAFAAPARADAIYSCGPLDGFARWYAASRIESPRVLAFGSTSVMVKQHSDDADERDLARRLREGEAGVFDAAAVRGAAATLLRPTLVYGAGRDATLTRIATLARRVRAFPLPAGATGRRQPVHVDDLANAARRACDAPASHGQAYTVPGGETLAYRDMVARVLATLQPPARLVELPAPLFSLLVRAARATGHPAGAFGDAALQRLREDLVFDAGPATRDFGYAPRPFAPDAAMFTPRG